MKTFNRRWTIGMISGLIVLCSSSIGLYVLARDLYSEREIRQLILSAYNDHRPGDGRLWGTPYVPLKAISEPQPDLGRAQVFLLRHPDIEDRQRLQGMVYIATGEWRAYVESSRTPDAERDASTLNDLGVVFLALSDSDPTYLLRALDQFERAAQLDTTAEEPRFNLVITYRRLRLQRLANESLSAYCTLDSDSPWCNELSASNEVDESAAVAQLRQFTTSGDSTQAKKAFEQDPELFRRLVMQYGLSNVPESPTLVRFIGQEIEERFNDRSISAMLSPLFTDRREIVLAVRNLVTQGAELYVKGDLQGSLEAYKKAEDLVGRTGSVFDRLWIEINRVDTWIRAGEFDEARESLRQAIDIAGEYKFLWLQAKALSVYGSTLRLTSGYAEMLDLLAKADRQFVAIGASNDRVRPLYYLAGYQYGAGDQTEALKLALECLRLTDDQDLLRVSSLDLLIGSILYRTGLPTRAALFEAESLEQVRKTKNASLEMGAASTLALLYESMAQPVQAERHLRIAEEAFKRVPAGFEQWKALLSLGPVKARIYLDQKRYKEAESILKTNLSLYSQQPFQVTNMQSQSLMLLAKVYMESGRAQDARQKFKEAVEIIENDDQYLTTEKLRVKFDDERRDLYDSAIDFEYSHGSPDEAWQYLQRYRAKMFLEFLAQFNPDIQRLRGTELSRTQVQKLVPRDTQIVEYALLKDRLLIWVISDSLFRSRSVPTSRAQVESDVQEVLQKLRNDKDADRDLERLGAVLIEPIADLLDPNRTIAIIPDRALHGLPFAALRRPGKPKYLIQNFPVLISPSLTYLLATDASKPERGSIVGFGSQFDDTSELRELTALKTIYTSARTFSGAGVDKPRFLTAMNTAPVVHYAGHSATDAVDPLRSSILLDGNRYGPNSVTAVDISQQRLWKNSVVVLSSCDSSVGNSRDGVGMRGLTSAFLIGGAGSVVGSLWPVEASSASQLMISFHRAFAAEQIPVAKALRQAQLAFLQSFPERSHPYYWSGFEVTGNFSALR